MIGGMSITDGDQVFLYRHRHDAKSFAAPNFFNRGGFA